MAKFRFVDEPVSTNEMPKDSVPAPVTNQSKKSRFRFIDENPSELVQNVKEIPKQLASGALQGATGTYGDILDLFGLQPKKMLPGERAYYEAESKASPQQLALMSDADEPVPRVSRLPSSSQVKQDIQAVGGPGLPETVSGRYAERIGKLVGGGASLGVPQAALSATAGAVGQTAEELGAPPWVQAALEIGTFLKGSKSKTPLTSDTPAIKQQLKKLEDLGFSQEDLTLAKNALEDRGWLKKTSKMTSQAESRFKQTLSNMESKIDDVIGESFPGIKQEGVEPFRKGAEELFDSLDEIAKNVVIEKPHAFFKSIDKAVESLRGTLANTPQEKEVINILKEAKSAAQPGRGADVYTRFYKGLNQIGKWGTPKEREHVFTVVKDAIKQTFRDNGPEGKRLAATLEDANKSWIKYLRAQDVSDLLAKASTDDGMNIVKLGKLLQTPSNYRDLSNAVGKTSADNIRKIADASSSVKDLEKAVKGGLGKEALGVGKTFAIAKAMLTGDITGLKAYVGADILGKVATKMLTEPKYQNINLKLIEAIKKNQMNSVRILGQRLAEEVDKDFLSPRRVSENQVDRDTNKQ